MAFAQVRTESGAQAGFVISEMSVSDSFGTRELITKPTVLKTSNLAGATINSSGAKIYFPDDEAGIVEITGNAGVETGKAYQSIYISSSKKRLKAKSTKGLFAKAWIGHQRDQNFNYFNLIFGLSGTAEETENGAKNRPHIALLPDGNGKFIRLAGYGCELSQTMKFNIGEQSTLAYKASVKLIDYDEELLLVFSQRDDNTTVLESISFKGA